MIAISDNSARFFRRISVFFFLACAAPPILAATQCATQDSDCGWTRLLNQPVFAEYATPRDLELDDSGNIYLLGEKYHLDGRSEVQFGKLDSGGKLLWVKHFSAPGGRFNIGYSIDVDGAGNSCLGGSTNGTYGEGTARRGGGFVARYDTQGQRLWATSGHDSNIVVGLDGKANCYAASITGVSKYDKNGQHLWRYQGLIQAMAVTTAGRIFLATRSDKDSPGLIILNSSGKELYRAQQILGQDLDWSGRIIRNAFMAADNQGGAYLQGSISGTDAQGTPRIESYLVRFNQDGDVQWEQHYGNATHRWDAIDVSVDGLGNSHQVGLRMTIPRAGPSDTFVISYDSKGQRQRVRINSTPEHDGAGSITSDRYGNFFILGGTKGDMDGQSVTVGNRAIPFVARNRPK
jgi:hypothetical protein